MSGYAYENWKENIETSHKGEPPYKIKLQKIYIYELFSEAIPQIILQLIFYKISLFSSLTTLNTVWKSQITTILTSFTSVAVSIILFLLSHDTPEAFFHYKPNEKKLNLKLKHYVN